MPARAGLPGSPEGAADRSGNYLGSALFGSCTLPKDKKRRFADLDDDPESGTSSASEDKFSYATEASAGSMRKLTRVGGETAQATSRKRKFSGIETEAEAAERGKKLRSRLVPEVTILPERRTFRDPAKYIYPSSVGERPAETRKAMGEDVTRDLMDRGPKDPFTASISRSVEPLKKGEAPKLAEHGINRNHILADSRIRVVLEKIAAGGKKNSLQSAGPEREALQRFFEAISGKEKGKEQFLKFVDAVGKGDKEARMAVGHELAAGRENLRFGLADINKKVSNEFDPVVVDGHLDPRSMEIRDAVIGLGHKGLISVTTVLDALAVTKDRFTHHDVTSTVLETSSLNEKTGSHTAIDHFAGPANPFKISRSRSIDFGTPSEKPKVVQPSREFHHESRPGFFKFTE